MLNCLYTDSIIGRLESGTPFEISEVTELLFTLQSLVWDGYKDILEDGLDTQRIG
jgi:hypothetical protein